ncbi:MAG: hypothetical protein GX557_12955, partial [Chloroflexi bacterium]|nr:hypothetical protein [Chloroflexota bacterium]
LGLGLEALGRRWRWPAWVIGAVLVAAMGLSTYRYFGVDRYAAKEDHRGAAQTIAAAERPGDAIIVTAPENVPVFAHYYRGRAPIIAMPAVAMTGNPDAATVASDLAAAIEPYERVWLVHCRTEFSDPQNLVTQWLDAHTLLLRRAVLPSWGSEVTLSAYLTRPALDAAAEPGEAQGVFGGQLALERVALRYYASDGAEGEAASGPGALLGTDVAPGSVMGVRLNWRVVASLEDLRTSLRLVDAGGVIWSQNDADPYLYWPTHEWPVGAAVRQEADLRMLPGTPPGRYRVELWVYRAGDGAVLSFHDADGAEQPSVVLGEVAVSADGSVATGEPWPPEAATRTRWNSSFGRLVQLQGYLLSPQRAAPGEAVALQLYWRALAESDRDLALEIQWRDAQDRVWHSTQQSLTGSDYGTAQWRVEQRLRGLLWLEVPVNAPPGRHRLHLVVRDGVGGEPLWVHYGPLWGASRDLPAAFIEIE